MNLKEEIGIINNLELIKVEIDIEKNILIVYCNDLGFDIIKTYYKNLWECYENDFIDKIKGVVRNGNKY